MTKPNYIVFDIETEPYDEQTVLADVEPFQPESVKLGNVKDPEFRRARIEEAHNKYYADILAGAALDATTGKVLLVGLYNTRENAFTFIEGKPEHTIIEECWTSLKGWHHYSNGPTRFVGFNILGFDLPFLIRRSWHYGLQVPAWVFDTRRFDYRCFVDLMQVWQCNDRRQYISLDRLARFIGLAGKQRSGKNFHLLYRGDRDQAIDYVKGDLELTAKIAVRMQA